MTAAIAAYGQDDSPSLGDVARQSRLQKQQKDNQAKDGTPAKDAKSASSKDTPVKVASAKDPQTKTPKKIVTNDEIPEHIRPTSTLPVKSKTPGAYTPPPNYGDGKVPPLVLEKPDSGAQGRHRFIAEPDQQPGGVDSICRGQLCFQLRGMERGAAAEAAGTGIHEVAVGSDAKPARRHARYGPQTGLRHRGLRSVESYERRNRGCTQPLVHVGTAALGCPAAQVYRAAAAHAPSLSALSPNIVWLSNGWC